MPSSPLSSLLGGVSDYITNKDIEKLYKNNQLKAKNEISPYLNPRFTPDDLTQDPGYQFNLDQGQKAIDRAAAARGGYFSGAALKEAQAFGQNLADRTYNEAYQRWLAEQQQGLRAARDISDLYTKTGERLAATKRARAGALTRALSGLVR